MVVIVFYPPVQYSVGLLFLILDNIFVILDFFFVLPCCFFYDVLSNLCLGTFIYFLFGTRLDIAVRSEIDLVNWVTFKFSHMFFYYAGEAFSILIRIAILFLPLQEYSVIHFLVFYHSFSFFFYLLSLADLSILVVWIRSILFWIYFLKIRN